MKAEGIFQFGEFRVDALTRTLRRDESIVAISGRAFDVLLYMVQNPGRLLTREELLKNVWADTFVDENSLAQSISGLRRALEEKPGDNLYIVTVPGRGYQFAALVKSPVPETVSVIPEGAIVTESAPDELLVQRRTIRTKVITEEERLSLPSRPNWTVRLVVGLAMVVAAVAVGYAWKQLRVSPSQTTRVNDLKISTPTRRSVAVLGFRNLSRRPEESWLSTALAEMLSTELVAGEKLRLVSGEDIARAKLDVPLTDADSLSRNTLARLHNDLDSDLIVLGSYTALPEKSGTRIRLDLHLQDTAAGDTIADIAVVGSETDLFDLVSQAGSELREKLGIEAVSSVEAVNVRASLPSNSDAARLYSEGLARLHVFDALAARDLLQQAMAADPKYSLTHSALAEAWSRLGYDRKAQQEAQQAYELAGNLSREEKLVVEGRYREIDHEFGKATEIYRTLFTLFPDNLDYGLKLADEQIRDHKGQDGLATVVLLRKLRLPASEDPRIEFAEAAGWNALGDFKHQVDPLTRGVEKARANGSRLILAAGLEGRCRALSYLEQTQNAVADCRESKEIYGSAGDVMGEATALRSWADAISDTDALESIRIYQQSQALYRKVGSEAGAAAVLNNLGLVYEAQGDLAAAEKMHRQAMASFRVLSNKVNEVAAIGNIADERVGQGDLRGGLRLYQEQIQLGAPTNTTNVALVGYNIASVRQLQGDLAGAKQGFEQSLAGFQKVGDQFSTAYAMWSLGSLLFEEADFSGSRKMYERALALRTLAGNNLTAAEAQLSLAELSLEEARSPIEQEAAIHQALEVFQQQKARDDETRAWSILARALFAQGKAPAAKEAIQHARSLAARSQNPAIRWQTAIAAGRVEVHENNSALSASRIATRKELTAIIGGSRKLGYQGIELEARLALAELEMKAGQIHTGRDHLAAIEADAKAKGYNLLARKAAVARG